MLWITFPSDWPDPATSETLWPGSWPLSVRGASVCWFGLRVPTCRKTHGEEEACPRQNIVRRPKPTSSYLQSVTLRVSLLQRYLDLYVLPEIQEWGCKLFDFGWFRHFTTLFGWWCRWCVDIYFHLIGENLHRLILNTDVECFLQNGMCVKLEYWRKTLRHLLKTHFYFKKAPILMLHNNIHDNKKRCTSVYTWKTAYILM